MASSAPQFPLLVIDTSSRVTWIGVKLSPDQLVYQTSDEDASRTLFTLAEGLLNQTNLELRALASIAYCEGPGSMLGARAAVMTLRTWQGIGIEAANRLFAFSSLGLGARLIDASPLAGADLLIATDARRNSWHSLPYPVRPTSSITIIENADLEKANRPIVTFDRFARWTKTTAELAELPYRPELVFANAGFAEILRSTPCATPLTLRESDYRKWTPALHSAPRP